jgi:hypothetical protein
MNNSECPAQSFCHHELCVNDDEAPHITITAPTQSAIVSSSSVLLSGSVEDESGSGIASVEYRVGDGAMAPLTLSSGGGFSVEVPVPAMDYLPRTATVRATDAVGNEATASVTFFVDYVDRLWTPQFGTASDDKATGVATDSAGNVYLAGATDGALDGQTNAGGFDAFLMKYDAAGTRQWTRQLGTAAHDYALGVATDNTANVYAAGYTGGALDGNISAGGNDLFVVKYNSSGVKQWTRQLGTAQGTYAMGAATDSAANVYVTGYTGGALDGNISAGELDLFVVKYNSSGVKQWTRQLGTATWDYAHGVGTDSAANANVYVVGRTGGALDGNISMGSLDLFVVKYNSSGVKEWTRQLGAGAWTYATSVGTDRAANVYVAGVTWGSLDGNTIAGRSDLFVVKYNPSGTKQWTRQLGTTADEGAAGVSVDSVGNVYVAGYTEGSLDGNITAGSSDAFILKYDPSGTKQWTRQLGSGTSDYAADVAVDTLDNIYVSGSTMGALPGNTHAGDYDLFIVKYQSDGGAR